MKKALALLLSVLLAASLSSAAFADGSDPPGDDGFVATQGQPVTVATEGQTIPPAESSEPEAPQAEPQEPEGPEQEEPKAEETEPESQDSSIAENSGSSEEENSASSREEREPLSSEEESGDESSRNEPESSASGPDRTLNADSGSGGPADTDDEIEDIPYVPENKGDVFNVRFAMMAMSVPEIHKDAPPTSNANVEISVATSGTTSPWIPVSGIPDIEGATISASTRLVFAIPDNNFDASGTASTFEANLTKLNTGTGSTGKVEVRSPGGTLFNNFTVQFVSVAATGSGRSYGVQLTPKDIGAEGLTLPAGTTFGFSGQTQANRYPLRNELFIASNSPGSTRATGITDGAELGTSYSWVTKNGSNQTVDFDDMYDVMAGDEYLIHFSPQFFEWSGNIPAKVTLANIRSKISLRQTGTTSSRVFEAVELATHKGEAVVRIKFRENLLSIKPIDFKTTLYLTVGGKRHEDSKLDINGTFGDMEPEEFYSEDREIDISDGMICIAKESMNLVKVYIGDGVTLTVPHIRKNAKFYGTVSMSLDKYDEELIERYPDIAEVYTLYTLGLNGAGVKVDIDTYSGFHVYDKDLKYLGQSMRKLDYSEKYYLAASMLDIDEDEDESGDGDGGESGDGYYPNDDEDVPPSQNPNKNPGTGR